MPSVFIGSGDLNRRIALRLLSEVPNVAFGLDQQMAAPLNR